MGTFTLMGVSAQSSSIPKVPAKMDLADMKLTITSQAQQDIQRDVNMLRASDRYFKVKLDRVALYMPIIERIFKEEGIPDDLKYLVLQESALISDAVSSSNAVGFWQFKSFTAEEVGMRVDDKIDERKNIVASTRGAAKYFWKHQKKLDNWAHTVTAHMTGEGGIKKYVKAGDKGAKKMTINKDSHWYLKRFLAHKIAFQEHLDHKHTKDMKLLEYTKGGGKAIAAIAQDFDVDEGTLKEYNKWLLQERIPDDRKYMVSIPLGPGTEAPKKMIAKNEEPKQEKKSKKSAGVLAGVTLKSPFEKNDAAIKVNGVPAIVAKDGETFSDLVARSGLPMAKFLKFNDLEKERIVLPGDIYFVKRKKKKSSIGFHVVKPEDTFWKLSQQYGIRMDKLAINNRMSLIDDLKPGRVLWMGKKRPNDVDVEYRDVPVTAPKEELVAREKDTPPRSTSPVTTTTDEPTSRPVSQKPVATTTTAVTPPVPAAPETEVIVTKTTGNFHVVQPGETLWRISKAYEVEVATIREWNNLGKNDAIQAGQELAIRKIEEEKASPETAMTATHVVEAGETLWKISKTYDIPIASLREWNGLGSDDALQPGQELMLSQTGIDNKPVAKSTATYVVQPGDTLYGIARSHNMELEELLSLNKKADNSLAVGEELVVHK